MSVDAWHDLLDILPDLKQIFDAAPGLIANDLPSLVSADGELQEQLDRAKNFHVGHDFKEAEPKIDGDRLFSKDSNARAEMHDEYAHFVDRETHDLESLKARRDAQASHLADYQRFFKRNAEFSNKAPDLIQRAATVSEEMAQELAGALMTTNEAVRVADQLVREYQRIVDEYDGKIREEAAAHAGHVSTLGIIEAISPKGGPTGHGTGEAASPEPKKPDVATMTGGATAGDRIRSAINGATAGVDAHASQSQSRLSLEQRQLGPARPMPSQQGPFTPVQQAPPDFSGTITVYPNSN